MAPRVLRPLAGPKCSQQAQHTSEYEVYFDHLCTHVDNFMPVVLPNTFTDGPTSGRWSTVGATGVIILRLLAVFREDILRVSQYFEVLYCGYCPYSQVLRGSILRVLPVPGVLYCSNSPYSQYLGIEYCSYSQYSHYLGRQYSNTVSTLSTKCTPHSEYTRSIKYTGSICEMLFQ